MIIDHFRFMAAWLRGHKQRKLNDHVYFLFCLCPLGFTIKLNFNISRVAYFETMDN